MRWKSYLVWSVAPLLLGFLSFGCLSIVDWHYESKLVLIRMDPHLDTTTTHLGPILLAIALGQFLLAGGFLFLLRLLRPWLRKKPLLWLLAIPLALGAIIFTTAGLRIVWFGPAALAKLDEMPQAPH